MTRQEPWAAFGPDQDTPGLPSVLVAEAIRAEQVEAAREQRERDAKRAELEDAHEARLHQWMVTRARQLSMEGRPFDMNDPATLVMSMDEAATRVFDAEDVAIARAERRQAIRDGRLHVIDVPLSEMSAPPLSAEEVEAERFDIANRRGWKLGAEFRRWVKEAVRTDDSPADERRLRAAAREAGRELGRAERRVGR